jgi:hypothetical protein
VIQPDRLMMDLTRLTVAVKVSMLLVAADLTFSKPPEWTPVKTTSSMRVAQFVVPRTAGDTADGEFVLYFFGGSGGSVEANIDRWIGQMQQPDGRPSSAVANRSSRTVNGMSLTLVDVTGTYVAEVTPGSTERYNSPNFRLRAAVVNTPKGPYFIKLTGPARTVAASERAFEQFVASLKYQP